MSVEHIHQPTLEHGSEADLETLDSDFLAKLKRELKLIQDISWNIGCDASPGVFERACNEHWGEKLPQTEVRDKFKMYFDKQVEMIKTKDGVVR